MNHEPTSIPWEWLTMPEGERPKKIVVLRKSHLPGFSIVRDLEGSPLEYSVATNRIQKPLTQ